MSIEAVIILVLIILLIFYLRRPGLSCVRSSHPGRSHVCFQVLGSYSNYKGAAELLAAAHERSIAFMRHLKHKYSIDEPGRVVPPPGVSQDIYRIVDNLLNNYNPEAIRENNPRNLMGDTSYTINKGQKMYLCVRNKDDPNKLVDLNTLMFVLLHEQSHIANYSSWGHDDRFWEVFKFILHEAVEAGVYYPVDYSQNPIVYCGLEVVYNPLFDYTLRSIWQ